LFRHAYEKLAKETDRRTGVKYFSLGPILDIGLQPIHDDHDESSGDEASASGRRPGAKESRWTTLAAWANAEASDMAPFVDAYARFDGVSVLHMTREKRGSGVDELETSAEVK
jgi:hypothetical protein